MIRQKQICMNDLKFLPPTLNFFLQILNWKRISEQIMYQNDHLKWKSKFLYIGSKSTKTVISWKIDHFMSVLSYIFPSRSENNKKKFEKKKKNSYRPTLFFSGCNLNNTYFYLTLLEHQMSRSVLGSGFAQAWKLLEFRGFLEKSLKIKSAWKSTGKSLKSLEKSLNSTIFCRT